MGIIDAFPSGYQTYSNDERRNKIPITTLVAIITIEITKSKMIFTKTIIISKNYSSDNNRFYIHHKVIAMY